MELTGTEALDLSQAAQIVSQIVGRPVERRVLADAMYREQLISAGFPPAGADMFLGIFAALHDGRFATVREDLKHLLGREPLTAATFLQQVAT